MNLNDVELPIIDKACYPSYYENLTLVNLEGDVIELDSINNKALFLNFWLTSCIPCLAEMKSIEKLYSQFGEKEIQFFIISHEPQDLVKKFLEKHNYELPIYTVKTTDLKSSIFYSRTVPATFFISSERKLIMKENKAVNWYSKSFIEFIENSL